MLKTDQKSNTKTGVTLLYLSPIYTNFTQEDIWPVFGVVMSYQWETSEHKSSPK